MHEFITSFCTALRAGGAPETTVRARREHLQHLVRRVNASKPSDVTEAALLEYFAGQSWAPETRRARRATMRKFWQWLAASGVCDDVSACLPPVRATTPSPRPCPDLAYRSALGRAKPRERLMLRLAAEMGLRRGEVAAIHARDVIDDLGGRSLVVHGKGGKRRVVPLPAGLAVEVDAMAAGGYLFPGRDDGHLSPRWVGRVIAGLLPAGLTMHTLRHRFASRAWMNGVDVFVIQDILGHASPSTTRRYVAVPSSEARRAVEGLAA